MTARSTAPTVDAVPANAADILKSVFDARYSCRGFRPEPVPRATIERILEIAQRTPSWCNSQPWQVVITSGAATERFREALSAHAAAHEGGPDFAFPREYRGVYLDRRRACGFQLYEAVGVQRGDRAAGAKQAMENFRLFGAPHTAIVTTDEPLGVYGAIDCGAWVNSFTLAAKSLGVASIAQAALARHPQFTRKFFGLPADRLVVCGISFGYEDAAHPANGFRTAREPIAQVATWLDA